MSWPINTPEKRKECGSVHPGDACRIQQHKSSTCMDTRRVGQADIALASSGKSTSFLCFPFCEVEEKMHPWKLLKVVVCVPQAVYPFTSVLWVQPQVKDRWARLDSSSPRRPALL